MELNREQIEKALDILDKMDFFQGQRAGRELWFGKPFEVQEQDISDFSQGIEFVKNVITKSNALIRELTEERKDFEIRALRAENEAAKYKDRWETSEKDFKRLADNAAEINRLTEKLIPEIKADVVQKMQDMLKKQSEIVYGDRAVCVEVIDQTAKEVLEKL